MHSSILNLYLCTHYMQQHCCNVLFTGWFKRKTQNSFRCQCPRRFWELDPEILHVCLVCPCQACNGCFCFFSFRQILRFSFFRGIFVSEETPHFRRKKKNIRERLGKGTVSTCAKFQGLTLKNGVDIRTFARLSAKITAWHCNYLVLVYTRFWALNLTWYWSYAVSSSNFCAKFCTCLGAPGSAWSRKKRVIFSFFFSSYSKCLSIIDLFESLWLAGTHFRC